MRNFLSAIPFVLLSLRAPDQGTPSGGGSSSAPSTTNPQPSTSSSDECPAIEGTSFEQKVESAGKIIKGLWDRLTTALARQKKAEDEKATLNDQFTTLQKAAEDEKKQHGVTKGLLDTMTKDLNSTKDDLKKATDNVTRLEGICGVKGLNKDKVVPAANGSGSGASDLATEYLDLKKKESKGEVPHGTASKFYSKHKKEIDSAK